MTLPPLPPLPARWYCVSRDGLATLCASEQNAIEMAADCARDYPRQAPYRAVLMCDVAAERERCARLLDAAHEQRKHLDNYAAYYARMIRECRLIDGPNVCYGAEPRPNLPTGG